MGRLIVACKSASFGERISQFLRTRGYAIELVHSGIDCLASLKRSVPDALILEWDLPWGGGAGVLACLREMPAVLKTAVVLIASEFSSELDMDAPVSQCVSSLAAVEIVDEAVNFVLNNFSRGVKPRFRFYPATCTSA